MFERTVQTKEALQELLGTPSPLAIHKVIKELDCHSTAFIAQSPFLLLATADKSGSCDVSPRGDEPGFVSVLDRNHLLIPERRGNKRLDSLYNILENPHIGLIFLIPGLRETLRVNGKASIITDEATGAARSIRQHPCSWSGRGGRGMLHSLRKGDDSLQSLESLFLDF